MINYLKLFGYIIKWRKSDRTVRDRRVDNACAEISNTLAENHSEDFPLLTKRGANRRSC